ncbi:MAG: hypothetical protein JSW39_28880 [Desulfobacterales bacterium]|nr:MAG: hypothetical protein JSW39_28880 [Desulfobacterales bacterium]
MNKLFPQLPFKIAAPSMVFGEDLVENVRRLAPMVDHVDVVLFYTKSLHNIPGDKEMRALQEIAAQERVTFTVHLPASLEVASPNQRKRRESVQFALELCLQTAEFDPLHYILHIPFSPPTLVPVPGLYFPFENRHKWDDWTKRARDSLEILHGRLGRSDRLLVENINYSPSFLQPFLKASLCELCLDLGHLLLGQENVLDILKKYLPRTREIHLHGVKGWDEHLGLAVLPRKMVHAWLQYLERNRFYGVLNLEVFSPQDLEASMATLRGAFQRE